LREQQPAGAVVFWDDNATIRAVTVSTGGNEDGSPIPPDLMLGREDQGTMVKRCHDLLVRVGDPFPEQIDGETITTIAVEAATPNHLLSLYFHARQTPLSWVNSAAQTIERDHDT
jgi:hypothetical protein